MNVYKNMEFLSIFNKVCKNLLIQRSKMNRISLLSGFLIACVISYASGLNSESIVGGVEANESQFPYQISLQVKGRNRCGGAILSDIFILTAAHCVINQTSNAFKDYAYKVVANTLHTKIRPIEVAVDKIYVLKDYNPELATNDIAVLKLEAPLDLKKNKLRAINLPSADKDYAGVKAVISGYGKNKIKIDYKNKDYPMEVGSSDGKLRYIAVDILSNTDCQINNYPEDIPETKICGKAVQEDETGKHHGICSGDSGGPLVYNDVIIGIVSSSPFGCDESKYAAAYTRVSSFLLFIQNVMNGRLGSEVREQKVVVNKPM